MSKLTEKWRELAESGEERFSNINTYVDELQDALSRAVEVVEEMERGLREIEEQIASIAPASRSTQEKIVLATTRAALARLNEEVG